MTWGVRNGMWLLLISPASPWKREVSMTTIENDWLRPIWRYEAITFWTVGGIRRTTAYFNRQGIAHQMPVRRRVYLLWRQSYDVITSIKSTKFWLSSHKSPVSENFYHWSKRILSAFDSLNDSLQNEWSIILTWQKLAWQCPFWLPQWRHQIGPFDWLTSQGLVLYWQYLWNGIKYNHETWWTIVFWVGQCNAMLKKCLTCTVTMVTATKTVDFGPYCAEHTVHFSF